MGGSGQEPKRYPWWQLILLGLAAMLESLIVRPIRRLWVSDDPLDTYALVQLASAAGDAMVAIAVAGPLLVPLLDRAGPRRAISLASAAGRAVVCVFAAPGFNTLLLYPFAFAILVLSRVHTITRNGLVMALRGRTKD